MGGAECQQVLCEPLQLRQALCVSDGGGGSDGGDGAGGRSKL